MVEEQPYSILKELHKRQHYKQRDRPSFSTELILYALLLRYPSKQADKLLLEKFPLQSFSLLEKIQSSGVKSITDAQSLWKKIIFLKTDVLMADEMDLQKGTQFYKGEYIGANEDEFYKEIMIL